MKGIYGVNLGASPGEKVLVFTDLITGGENPDPTERKRREGLVPLARAAAQAGRELALDVRYIEFPALGSHGTEPGDGLWDLAFGGEAAGALREGGLLMRLRAKTAGKEDIEKAREVVGRHRKDAVDAVIALSNYSTSHTRFRDLLTSVAGTRYASMPLFEEDMLQGSMDADWEEVAGLSDRIARAVDGGDSVRVTTPAGTDITFGIKGRRPMTDTGVLREPGSFSNLPAGEVYLAPVEGTGEGVLVLEWAPNRKLASPLRVVVKGGLAREVAGDEPFARELAASFERLGTNRNLAELGIGTNEKASRPDNILESEKILGTVHLAFGDNTSMGGAVSTPFHQDFVFFSPTLTVRAGDAEKTIIRSGRLEV
ncbi:MAG TPA: peptidase [Nitrospirota bacterium]|nr:peptidase [Nitrospirota bacterium]